MFPSLMFDCLLATFPRTKVVRRYWKSSAGSQVHFSVWWPCVAVALRQGREQGAIPNLTQF